MVGIERVTQGARTGPVLGQSKHRDRDRRKPNREPSNEHLEDKFDEDSGIILGTTESDGETEAHLDITV